MHYASIVSWLLVLIPELLSNMCCKKGKSIPAQPKPLISNTGRGIFSSTFTGEQTCFGKSFVLCTAIINTTTATELRESEEERRGEVQREGVEREAPDAQMLPPLIPREKPRKKKEAVHLQNRSGCQVLFGRLLERSRYKGRW